MKRLVFVLIVLGSSLIATIGHAAGRSGVVTVEVDLSGQQLGEAAKVWLPYPVSDRNQLVSDIRVSGDYASSGVYTDPVHGTHILYATWPAKDKSRKLTLSFAVDRQEVIRRDFPEKEPTWNRSDYAEYLAGTSIGPVDGEVKAVADRITKGKNTVLEKARAIYDWTCENTCRDPKTVGCGTGDVCSLLRKPEGKCTDISSLYIALCRAAGVPAREVFGIRLGKKPAEDITGYQHCWAEFFVPGYGWVPADPADVRKAMLVEKLGLKDPKTAQYRSYFWGGIDAYRVALATGRDLVLNPPQEGKPLNTFGYPYAEVGGKVIDWYDAAKFSYRISFREK